MPANPEIVAYIRQRAQALGIDPEIALRVAGHEALNVFDPNQPDRGGDKGSSFGVYQLHYGGIAPGMKNPGLGDRFTAATGLDARDPSTWRQQIDFALQTAKREGWGAWMGAKAEGITGFMGIGSGGSPSGESNDPRSDTPHSGHPQGSTLPGPQGGYYGGSGSGSTVSATPYTPDYSSSPYALKDDKKDKRKKFGSALADAVAGMGGKGDQQQFQAAPELQSARVDAPAPAPIFNMEQANNNRQYLAQILAQLNSNKVA